MKFEEAIEELLVYLEINCYRFNREKKAIEKSTIMVHSASEQMQMLKIVEALDELGVKYEIDLKGTISIR